jgi:hypothetical protein
LARSKPFADGADDCEVGGGGDGHEAFADRVDELPATVYEAGEWDAPEEGTAPDPDLDDVGDPVVEPVEEKLEAGQDPRLDDRVRGDGTQSRDGVGCLGCGQAALAEQSADLAELLLDGGVGLGALGPSLGESVVDPGRERRQVGGNEPLRIHDESEVRGVGDRLHPDDEVVLRLEDAEDPWPDWIGDDLGFRAPAELVDGVVGLSEVDVESGSEGRPPEPSAVCQGFPSGRVLVALVEDDDRLG